MPDESPDANPSRTHVPASTPAIAAAIASRVTLADIAREAGVSRAAVSYALRGGKGTSADTQARIRRIARDLGYRPDPELTRLMMHLHAGRIARRGGGAARFAGKLALLNPHSEERFARQAAAVADFFRGVSTRARELGYETEEFWLREPGRSPRRLAQMLFARGIQGVVLGSTAQHGSVVEFPWENFAAVTVGYTVVQPVLHRVVTHHYRNTRLALAQVKARGWRRIGLVAGREAEAIMEDLHLAAFARHLDSVPKGDRVPALVFDNKKLSTEVLQAWWREHRPEVVLSTAIGVEDFAKAGVRVPQDVQLVKLLLWDEREGTAGVLPGYDRLGTAAAEMLAGQLARGELGLPADPKIVLVEGRWRDGVSLGSRV
ncbi:LacI family transcriptional regulator [Opitutaceae bacterium TAV4]|nr:LacI family transcriptional regulator [Opitutaceae bacterium TAV4]RRK00690.1 LacI family transcriptional regulator [Opitutaceae bacterium TAV3]